MAHIIGVDVSTKAIAFGHWVTGGEEWYSLAREVTLPGKTADERLGVLPELMHLYLLNHAGDFDLMIIERIPFVRGQNGLSISRALGAVEAIFSLRGRRDDNGRERFGLVNVSTWKKDVIGHGHATKGEVQALVWDQFGDNLLTKPEDMTENMWDAVAIGAYGVIKWQG